MLRINRVTDTTYKTRADTTAFERADSKLGLNLFTVESLYVPHLRTLYRKNALIRSPSIPNNARLNEEGPA